MSWLRWVAIVAVVLPSLARATDSVPPRALWLWDPVPLLEDAGERRDFFAFCEQHRIGVVWAQIGTHAAGAARRLDRADAWTALLAEVHRHDMQLHALDGDPHYALPARHAAFLSVVDAVIAFNAASRPGERFDGVHFDVEPHQLLAWSEPAPRETLLADFLAVNERAAARARAAGLAYGVDVPFWFPATARLLRSVDNLGIMDYRTSAAGPDGIIEHAIDTIEQADSLARTSVFVGVETSVHTGTFLFLTNVPRAALRDAIVSHSAAAAVLDERHALVIDDGEVVHIGIEKPCGAADVLAGIAAAFSLAPVPPQDEVPASIQAAFRREGGWSHLQPRAIRGGEASFASMVATQKTPPNVTFAGKPFQELLAQLTASEHALAGHRSFAGMAIHQYVSFRHMANAAR